MTASLSIEAPESSSASRESFSRRATSAIAPVLILIVFLVGYSVFIGFPRYPVADASERIAYSAIAATILASLVAPRTIRALINLVAAAACVVPTLLPLVRPNDLTYGSLALWTAGVCIPTALLATRLHCLRDRGEALLVNLLTLGMTLAAGALLMSTGSLKLGEAGFSLASGVLVVVIFGLFVKQIGNSWGISTLAFAVLAGLLTSGYVWSELPLYAALCVAAAVPLVWVARIPLLARRPTWQRVIVGLLIAAIPAAVAVTIEGIKANRASQEMSDESSY